MKITRILNNNVVEAKNEHNNPLIIIGRGIGHNRKRNDTITMSDADEMFLLTNKNLFPSIENLLTSVSTDLIETSNKIVSYGKKRLGHNLNQNIIISLTDHLDYAIARARDGFTTPNPLNWDIRRFYPQEYEVGLYALQVVKKFQFTVLPEDEAGFIAMHFVDASIEGSQSHNITSLTRIIKRVLEVVETNIENVDTESLAYSRFIRHVQYMAIRVIDHAPTSEDSDPDIMRLVFAKYPKEFNIAKLVRKELNTDFDVEISESELMYVTMHLARLMNNR